MQPWFWGWLATTVALAAVAAIGRDRSAAAFAIGAACATALAGLRVPILGQWTAFLLVSLPLLTLAVRRRYRRRHGPGASRSPER